MSPGRIKQRLSDFEKALERLKEVLKEDPAKTSAIIDGTIQRFEFTFELAWKLGRDVLYYNGIEANNPRSVIKELFKEGFIQEGEAWIEILDDRNQTSHIYDEAQARKVYEKIKGAYCYLSNEFKEKILTVILEMKDE